MLKRLMCLWMLISCAGIPVFGLNPVEKPTAEAMTPQLESHALTSSTDLEELRETLTTAKSQRKKIGLVLSGGGARGFAHIGVLEWFEENRIPIDSIAGTSMGALVGGMYTMGMKPKEIRAFMKSIDWNKAIGTGPTYDQLQFRRKEDRNSYQTNFELGLKKGPTLPLGISPAHYIGLMIDRLTLPYAKINNFDELPIPFRCVATDFLSGKTEVMRDKSLAQALRATMSIPGLFPPVEREGKILVDGALLNNIPTDAMRDELKPDIVIAVDVGTPLGDLKAISSFLGILQQSLTIMTLDSDRRNLAKANIIISPQLEKYSLLDFKPVDDIANLGYKAATESESILSMLSIDASTWDEYLIARNERQRSEIPIPTGIDVRGTDVADAELIKPDFEDMIGRPLDFDDLEANLTKYTGVGRYDSLGYEFSPKPKDNTLIISVLEKTYAPPTMNFGLEIDGSDVNNINFTVGTRLTFFDLVKHGTEWRNDVRLGFQTYLASEFFYPLNEIQPFGYSGFFAAPRVTYQRRRQNVFVGDRNIAEYQLDRTGLAFDIGRLDQKQELRFGLEFGRTDAKVRAGDPGLPSVDGRFALARIRWAFDGQDSATVPSKGLRTSVEGRWFFDSPNSPGTSGSFPQAEARFSFFKPAFDKGSMFLVSSGGSSFNYDATPTESFTVGGPFRLSSFDRDEFRGNHYFLNSLGYLRPIGELPPLIGKKVFVGGWYDIGGAWGGPLTDASRLRYRQSFSAGLVVDTIFGPFSLIGSVGESGRGKIFFAFGKFF